MQCIESLEARRLLAFADVVPSWGEGGVVEDVQVFAEQADGKVLGRDDSYDSHNLIRLNADGSLDTTFSGDGKVPWTEEVAAMRQVAGGKVLIAYHYFRHNSADEEDLIFGYGVARFTARGKVDRSFGDNGSIVAAFRESRIGEFPDFGDAVIDADGSTYFGVSGNTLYAHGTGGFSSFVLKFDVDGRRDANYGSNGVFVLPRLQRAGRRSFVRTINDLELTDGGGLLVAGTELRFDLTKYGGHDYQDLDAAASSFVTRLTPAGVPDAKFATSGTFKIDKTIVINGRDDTKAAKVIRQANGHVLLVSRVDSRLRVVTLGARGQWIAALNRAPAESVGDDGAGILSAEGLPDGRLLVTPADATFELRPTGNGFAAQPPRLPFAADAFLSALVLRDGSVLRSGTAGTMKISTGDGQTPRDDDIPFGRQNAITTPGVGYGYDDIPQLDAFFHDERGGLKYRARDAAGRWGAVETVDPAPNAGIFLSSFGTFVAYTDGSTGDLKFARRRRGGVWKVETIDRAGATGFYCSLVKTSDAPEFEGDPPDANTYAVAYYDRTRGDLRLATRDTVGKWTTSTVDSRGNVGRYAKLSRRLDSQLSIAYATNNTAGVRLAEQRGGKAGGWSFTDLDMDGADVDGLDIDNFLTNNDLEPAGASEWTTTVAVYDAAADDLVVAYRATEGGTFTTFRETSAGNVGLNPHVSHYEAGVVSFYDETRDQVRQARIVESDMGFVIKTDAVPIVASAGAFANPVVSTEPPGIYNDYAGGGYTSTYAWVDDEGVLRIRGPV